MYTWRVKVKRIDVSGATPKFVDCGIYDVMGYDPNAASIAAKAEARTNPTYAGDIAPDAMLVATNIATLSKADEWDSGGSHDDAAQVTASGNTPNLRQDGEDDDNGDHAPRVVQPTLPAPAWLHEAHL